MNNLALAARHELPDALRVLLAEYPRNGWVHDPGFDGLVRFWLDRHIMFRRILGDLLQSTETLLDHRTSPEDYAVFVAHQGGMFVNGLHEHHTIEDTYYFPKLAKQDARIAKGFDILDKDHHDIDGRLAGFVDAANAVIRHADDRDRLQSVAGAFRADLNTLERLLDRHLVDEEELVVPVILKYGAPNFD